MFDIELEYTHIYFNILDTGDLIRRILTVRTDGWAFTANVSKYDRNDGYVNNRNQYTNRQVGRVGSTSMGYNWGNQQHYATVRNCWGGENSYKKKVAGAISTERRQEDMVIELGDKDMQTFNTLHGRAVVGTAKCMNTVNNIKELMERSGY